ncbi:tol-pal system protein YbgF [Methylogaea oryzae]|uniref:Cell division coordinator CpoB n=1 Tax=Methylogaea oryzae TaxID=1295382 RepID=A0A8D4VPY6_9GAMM|nr:tol-pal system protein YbgF [Methylogaea oryzae]BBL71214.1 tol-pal system protein YbgF [Methylogaea oryzae]
MSERVKVGFGAASCAVAASLILGGVPARAADETYATVANLIDRVGRLEQRLSGPALAQMVGQSDELRSDIQSLRGDLEQLTHEIEELKQQQRAQYQDLDQRLQALAAGGSASRKAAGGGDDGSASNAGQPAVDSAAAEAAQQAYQKAFDSVKEGRYKEGIGLFKSFLSSYPTDESAPNAQYWLGECYYVTQDFNGAREAFRKLLDAYPKSPKAADALLRLGNIEYDGKKWPAASQIFNDVGKRFPGTSAAQKAQERLQQMKKEGH